MHNLVFRYTRWMHRHQQRNGHLFQGRYQALLVETDPYVLVLVRYHSSQTGTGRAGYRSHGLRLERPSRLSGTHDDPLAEHRLSLEPPSHSAIQGAKGARL